MAYPITITFPLVGSEIIKGTKTLLTWNYPVASTETSVDLVLFRGIPPTRYRILNIASFVPIGINGIGSYEWDVPTTLSDGTTYVLFLYRGGTGISPRITLGYSDYWSISSVQSPCTPVSCTLTLI